MRAADIIESIYDILNAAVVYGESGQPSSRIQSLVAHAPPHMPRSSLPWLVLGTLGISAALAWFTLTRGGGPGAGHSSAFEHHALAPFTELEIGGAAEVIVLQGGAEAIDVEAAGRANVVEANVSRGRLVIRSRDRRHWWGRIFGHEASQSPTITIHLRNLDVLALTGTVKVTVPKLTTRSLRIAASGGSALTIDELRANTLRVEGSGALKADLAGRVDDEHVSISGAGSYHAERLRATDATVSVSGVAKVIVHAERKLNASISGAGLIEYLGDPEVVEEISGIGRVKRRDSSATPGMRIARAQCSGEADDGPASLNSNGPPVAGSTSAWTPVRIRTSGTRQSRSNPTSIVATSPTGSYG